MNKQNCAIYVRKSTEKGLEQEFNSLQNQEEACRNYILSQAFNGWEYYRTFEDGGISGGTMKRPALMEMMEEIKAGKIQVVCTYKVDRLSRSIMDFHNMMKEFDKYNCCFVSITQAFDTSTSMGKLTLNMLLSFAQFEREVASERIRDKISASKAKGMWMGGNLLLGYDIKDKKLVVNKQEAETVRFIFEKYLEFKSIRSLCEYLNEQNIRAKKWVTKGGRTMGGGPLIPSRLAVILRSRLYIGKIENKKDSVIFEGRHRGIVPRELFQQVQEVLDKNQLNRCSRYEMNSFPLSGKLFDTRGNSLKNRMGTKNQTKKYRYYGIKEDYIPAGDLEEIAAITVKQFLNAPLRNIVGSSFSLEFKAIDFDNLTIEQQTDLIRAIIGKIIIHRKDSRRSLTFFIPLKSLNHLAPFLKENYINIREEPIPNAGVYCSSDGAHLIIEKEICINNRHFSNLYVGKGKKLISITENSHNLVRALAFGWRYRKMTDSGMTAKEVARADHRNERTVYRYLNLNYLSPGIVNSIMDGRVPPHVDLQALFDMASRYSDFRDQEKLFFME